MTIKIIPSIAFRFAGQVILPLLLTLTLAAQENTAISCADGLDNDGDGQIDCEDPECNNLPNFGCVTCEAGISFADTVLAFTNGCPAQEEEPAGALGVSDGEDLSNNSPNILALGSGGRIALGFTNNLLTNSGDEREDIFIFEVGTVEPTFLGVRPADNYTREQLQKLAITDNNGNGFYVIAEIGPLGLGFDLDMVMPGYDARSLRFDAVELIDVLPLGCGDTSPGPDIDAVCALSFIPFDCRGILDGDALIDDCGVCREVDDPLYNASCTDCAGTPYGAAVIDNCGVCLLPGDPDFNNTCVDKHTVYLPNAFSPNEDGFNDRFVVYTDQAVVEQISQLVVFNRWGEKIYHVSNIDPGVFDEWWDGSFRNEPLSSGVFSYFVEVEFIDGVIELFSGEIALLR